jgi:hypothetical protein
MKNLLDYVNQGYLINVQGKNCVVGYNKKKNDYVCWYYDFKDNEPYFYWGYYTVDYDKLYDKFKEREGRE